jgi:hypothetical protein
MLGQEGVLDGGVGHGVQEVVVRMTGGVGVGSMGNIRVVLCPGEKRG